MRIFGELSVVFLEVCDNFKRNRYDIEKLSRVRESFRRGWRKLRG